MFLYLKYIFSTKHIGDWFSSRVTIIVFQSVSGPFIFNVITDTAGFNSTILGSIFCLSHLFFIPLVLLTCLALD